jgi:hypothetical protein
MAKPVLALATSYLWLICAFLEIFFGDEIDRIRLRPTPRGVKAWEVAIFRLGSRKIGNRGFRRCQEVERTVNEKKNGLDQAFWQSRE